MNWFRSHRMTPTDSEVWLLFQNESTWNGVSKHTYFMRIATHFRPLRFVVNVLSLDPKQKNVPVRSIYFLLLALPVCRQRQTKTILT